MSSLISKRKIRFSVGNVAVWGVHPLRCTLTRYVVTPAFEVWVLIVAMVCAPLAIRIAYSGIGAASECHVHSNRRREDNEGCQQRNRASILRIRAHIQGTIYTLRRIDHPAAAQQHVVLHARCSSM